MPFITSGPSLRRLPLFFAYCPDRSNVLAKRLEVRPAHWARFSKDSEEGYGEFGLGYKPPPSQAPTTMTLPPNVQEMDGSLLIFRAKDLDSAWNRIREDVYWTEGVWEREKCVVKEFIRHQLVNDEV